MSTRRTGVTGAFRRLHMLKERITGMGSRQFRHELSLTLAQAARTQIIRGFELSRDPYGKPWKPSASRRAARKGHKSNVLGDTNILQNSIAPATEGAVAAAYSVTPQGFAIGTNVRYAAIHQFGGVIRPKKETVRTVTRKLKDGSTTTYQQRFRGLRFRVVTGHTRGTRPKAQYSDWIIVQKVTMPKRSFMPSGRLGPIWTQAFQKLGRFSLACVAE